MSYEHRHDLAELEREEALMEAEDIAQAKFDQRKLDFLKEYVDQIDEDTGKPKFYQEFDDCMVNVTEEEKDRLIDYLRLGHTQMFQWVVGGILFDCLVERI